MLPSLALLRDVLFCAPPEQGREPYKLFGQGGKLAFMGLLEGREIVGVLEPSDSVVGRWDTDCECMSCTCFPIICRNTLIDGCRVTM